MSSKGWLSSVLSGRKSKDGTDGGLVHSSSGSGKQKSLGRSGSGRGGVTAQPPNQAPYQAPDAPSYEASSDGKPHVWQPPRSTTPDPPYVNGGANTAAMPNGGTWSRGQPPSAHAAGGAPQTYRQPPASHYSDAPRQGPSLYVQPAPPPSGPAFPPPQRAPGQVPGAGERRPDSYRRQGEPQGYSNRDAYPAQHQYGARAAPAPRIPGVLSALSEGPASGSAQGASAAVAAAEAARAAEASERMAMAKRLVPAGSAPEESAESAVPGSYPQAASPAAAPSAAGAPQSPVMLGSGEPDQVLALAGTPPLAPVPESGSEHSPLAVPAPAEAPLMSPRLSQKSPMLPPLGGAPLPVPQPSVSRSSSVPATPKSGTGLPYAWRSPVASPVPEQQSEPLSVANASSAASSGSAGRATSRMGQMAASVASVLTSARTSRSASPARGQVAPPAPVQKPEPASAPQPPPELPSLDGNPALTAGTSFLLPFSANGARPRKRTEEKPASKVLRAWKPGMSKEVWAATRIQAAIRGYWARGALRALRSLVRLQALVRGHIVRKQAAATLRCMHAIVRVQAIARGRRVRKSREGLAVQRRVAHVHIRQSKASLTHQEEREKNAPLKLVDMVHRKHVDGWNSSTSNPADQQERLRRKREAIKKRERAYAYGMAHAEAYRQSVKKVVEAKQSSMGFIDCAPDKGGWGWSWLERWQVAQPWENPLMMSHHYQWVRGQAQGAQAHAAAKTPTPAGGAGPSSHCRHCGRRISTRTVKPTTDQYIPQDLCNICAPTVSWLGKQGISAAAVLGTAPDAAPPVMIDYSSPAKLLAASLQGAPARASAPPPRPQEAKTPAALTPGSRASLGSREASHSHKGERGPGKTKENTPPEARTAGASSTPGSSGKPLPRFMEMTASRRSKVRPQGAARAAHEDSPAPAEGAWDQYGAEHEDATGAPRPNALFADAA